MSFTPLNLVIDVSLSAPHIFWTPQTDFSFFFATVWMSWAPLRCKFFLWLDRCWTVDKLARQGLPYQPCCPLCDHNEEDIEHPRFNLCLLPPSLVRCPRHVRPASNDTRSTRWLFSKMVARGDTKGSKCGAKGPQLPDDPPSVDPMET